MQELENVFKQAKFDEIMRKLSECLCPKCVCLTQRWRSIDQTPNEYTLPYNIGDACPSTEVAMHTVSHMFGSTSKSTFHNLAKTVKCYRADSGFALGIAGISQPCVHHELLQVSNSLSIANRLPLLPHFVVDGGTKGLSTFHSVDGDSGYIVLDNIPGLMSKYRDFGSQVQQNISICTKYNFILWMMVVASNNISSTISVL